MVRSMHINNMNGHYRIKHCIAEIPYKTTKPGTLALSSRGIPLHHRTITHMSLSWTLFLKAHNIHSVLWGPSHLLVIDSRLAVISKISFDILCSDILPLTKLWKECEAVYQYYLNQTLFLPMSCAWYLGISESIFWMLLLSYTMAGNTDGNHNCKHLSKYLVLSWTEIVYVEIMLLYVTSYSP